MSDVAANLAGVRARMAEACERAGRAPAEVQLLAVSKLQPTALIRAAWEAGQRDFGENYAQELRDKVEELSGLQGIRWHAIGPLQTNKVKYVARSAVAFHALDRVDVARELGRRRVDDPIVVYVEVNVGGEASKGGVAPAEVGAFFNEVRGIAGLDVVGLMCMPPWSPDPETSRPHFRRLRALAAEIGVSGLSMGTTEDFAVAIEEGATIVRVGRSIFGERVG